MRQVVLVDLGERAHDAEVERDVAAKTVTVGRDEDVARVHVGVEDAVAEDLREEDLDAGTRELLQVDTGFAQAADLADRDAVHALHGHHVMRAVIPENLGHFQQLRIGEVAAQLRAVGRFAHQVEFVGQMLGEFAHDLARLEALAVAPEAFEQAGEAVEQRDVMGNHRRDGGPQYLDGDFMTALFRR